MGTGTPTTLKLGNHQTSPTTEGGNHKTKMQRLFSNQWVETTAGRAHTPRRTIIKTHSNYDSVYYEKKEKKKEPESFHMSDF